MSKSLLDLMPKDEAEKAIERGKKRMQSSRGKDISPEMFVLAEFGYYFGWNAIQAVKNDEITLKEVLALIEGAKKVWFSKVIDQSHGTAVANSAVHAKDPTGAFNSGMQPFIERTRM